MSDISREDEIIGANVKKFRESQGISRKDLAHIFHISEDGVYRIERGEQGYPAHMPIYWQTSYIVI